MPREKQKMEWLVLATFVMALLTSILSGMSGGGGAFIMTPYFLLVVGLPPANAIATMKLGGIGMATGSITAFRGKGFVNKKLVVPLMAITFVCALVSAWLIPNIDADLFSRGIGLMLLALIPTLFIKRAAFQPGHRPASWIAVGFVAYTIITFLLTLVGTGLGGVLVLILMFLFGLGTLESQATKRVAVAVQAVILFALLAVQGLVIWTHGLAGLLGAVIGSHIGTLIAIKKGGEFVKIMLAVVMAVSGVVLLL